MTEAEKKAREIYGLICETSGDRPLWGNTVEQITGVLSEWKAKNPALEALGRAEPEVQLCFVANWFDWLEADVRLNENVRIGMSAAEGIQVALAKVPKPLPAELICAYSGDIGRPGRLRCTFIFHSSRCFRCSRASR